MSKSNIFLAFFFVVVIFLMILGGYYLIQAIQQGTQIPVQTNVNNTITVQFTSFTLNLTVTPQITDAGVAHLKGMTQLETLNFYNCKITDAAFDQLHGLAMLRNLDLGKTKVTDAGVERLKKALPKVQVQR